MGHNFLLEYIESVIESEFSELDEFTKITEPKRDGLPMSQLGLKSNGGVHNIMAVYNQATPEERDYWGKWYHNAKNDVQELANIYKLPFPVMAAIVAVLSPGNKWYGNLLAADRVLKGDPKVNAYPAQTLRAKKILETGNTGLVTGPKVTVFFKSLMEPQAVEKDMILDGHAINIWRGQKVGLKGLKNPSTTERTKMVNDYKTAAEKLGVPVQAVQAVTWYIWKYTNNDVPQVQKGTYDVSQFTGVKPSNDNATPSVQSTAKVRKPKGAPTAQAGIAEEVEELEEVNAVGAGGVVGYTGPVGMDTESGHDRLWSNPKEKGVKTENVLDKQGHKHVGGASRKAPYGDTYVDKDDTGKQADMIRKVNQNMEKKPYTLHDPPAMGLSITRDSLKDRKNK